MMIKTAQTQDTVARLLATENISVIRESVQTASFDLKNRVLRLPMWKNMTPAIEEMLVLHEVGHALFTETEKYISALKDSGQLAGYANVIEDARIERMMKVRYPGARKSFNSGYRELNERDFFKISDRDLSKMLLIDRINLYFKVGFNCGVRFSTEEMKFVRRADTTVTVEDVIQLAKEIYEFSKEERAKQKEELANIDDLDMQELMIDQSGEFGDGDGDGDGDEAGEEDDQRQSKTTGREAQKSSIEDSSNGQEGVTSDEDLESHTDKALSSQLSELADTRLEINYYTPEFYYSIKGHDCIVPFAKVMERIKNDDYFAKFFLNDAEFLAQFRQWKSASDRVVSYLVKEFEMKKSASAYKRAKQAKLGQLDPRKLYAYKLKDDLFKQVTRVFDGKKHSMVFLLDWSGSMRGAMKETVEQVMNLAMFCQRVGITYQVFAFTDRCTINYGLLAKGNAIGPFNIASKTGIGDSKFSLLELLSSKMTSVEFNTMVKYLRAEPYTHVQGMSLGGTPLNEALLYMVDYLGKFINKNQTEKNTLVVLTDGEGNELENDTVKVMNGFRWFTSKVVKSILVDPMTKKEYNLSNDGAEQTTMFLKIIKDRYNVNVVRYFVAEYNRDVYRFFKINSPNSRYSELGFNMIRQMKKHNAGYMENFIGCDELYMMSARSKVLLDVDLHVKSDMKAREIAKQLSASMNQVKTSRVILDKFIHLVS